MTSIAFMGSHPLGEQCLEIATDHPDTDVELVVTYGPDEDNWWDGSLYDLATELGHDVVTIDEESQVLERDVDYLLSVYYPNILGAEMLNHPNDAAINLHQAELPRYRGSNVISHAIMNARDDDHWQYGTTMHFMAEEVDAGDVIARNFVEISEDDTARELYERIEGASVDLFDEMLPAMVSGEILEMGTPQAEYPGERYFYTKASLDGEKAIDPETLTDPERQDEVYDKVRALDFPPFEPAWVELEDGRKLYLTASDYEYVLEEVAAGD